MSLVPVKITIYDPGDCTVKDQQDLLDKRIIRISNEAHTQGDSTKTISRHISALEKKGELVPTRGKWKDIGPGVSHKKRIMELYLKGYEYTDIERKTKNSGEPSCAM